jgi:hypothetical protein
MFTLGLFCQSATITYHTKQVGLVESDRHHHLIERNVTFTPNESSEKKLTLRQTTVTR